MYHFRCFRRHAAHALAHACDPPPARRRKDGRRAMKPTFWDEARRGLGRADPVMRRLIRRTPGVHLVRRGDPVTTLARAIVGPQISVKAAQTIWARFAAASGSGADVTVPGSKLDAARVSRMRMPALRRCGLSERKADYLRDLARHFTSGALDPAEWPALDDEALIARLVDVRGIGRWTAEMFLIFHELRADVFPVGDVGLQKAIAMHYNDGERLDVDAMHAVAAPWRPWRSVATWYLWRSLDPIPVEY